MTDQRPLSIDDMLAAIREQLTLRLDGGTLNGKPIDGLMVLATSRETKSVGLVYVGWFDCAQASLIEAAVPHLLRDWHAQLHATPPGAPIDHRIPTGRKIH